MTKEYAKQLLPFIQAFAEGKVLQIYDGYNNKWEDLVKDNINFEYILYPKELRIKSSETENENKHNMAKYQVIRTFHHTEYAYVEANSAEEAKQKAINNDCWEENPNDIFLGYEYITTKEDK